MRELIRNRRFHWGLAAGLLATWLLRGFGGRQGTATQYSDPAPPGGR